MKENNNFERGWLQEELKEAKKEWELFPKWFREFNKEKKEDMEINVKSNEDEKYTLEENIIELYPFTADGYLMRYEGKESLRKGGLFIKTSNQILIFRDGQKVIVQNSTNENRTYLNVEYVTIDSINCTKTGE